MKGLLSLKQMFLFEAQTGCNTSRFPFMAANTMPTKQLRTPSK
jgi:hypothetical protein